MSKLKNILQKMDVINDTNDNNLLLNLTKIPPKEGSNVMPHYTNGIKNARIQADLLYLPDDRGYKYLLVAVDIATRVCDCEPLKKRDAETVKVAMTKIFKRKILTVPSFDLQVDGGSEFKGVFEKHFSKLTHIFTKLTGRSRQQAVVEARNKTIGAILNTKMLADEIATDETSREWVKYVPIVVKLINEEYSKQPDRPNIDAPLKIDKLNKTLLPIGTRVRLKLDIPRDYVSGDKLGGKTFRSGDIRWTKDTHTITQIYLNPGQAPAYQIDNKTNVSYTRPQLQIVNDNEIIPNSDRQYAQRIINKRKVRGKVEYEIEWENKETSWEEYNSIKEDLKDMINKYNKSNKNK